MLSYPNPTSLGVLGQIPIYHSSPSVIATQWQIYPTLSFELQTSCNYSTLLLLLISFSEVHSGNLAVPDFFYMLAYMLDLSASGEFA
jgi:hypothetical protein